MSFKGKIKALEEIAHARGKKKEKDGMTFLLAGKMNIYRNTILFYKSNLPINFDFNLVGIVVQKSRINVILLQIY